MLFSSYLFLFLFLPAVLACLWALRHNRGRAFVCLVVLSSLVFYSYWSVRDLAILSVLTVITHFSARFIHSAQHRPAVARLAAALCVLANLAFLCYFKYSLFIADNVAAIAGVELDRSIWAVALPLGISFFVFQKIAYVIDVLRKEAKPMAFLDFVAFISFFPQLIAGPIVHHSELAPQLKATPMGGILRYWPAGFMFLLLGLFKKVVIADSVAPVADEAFQMYANGDRAFAAAWTGMLAYSLQLYFDFSGYSDMAIGLGLFFGVALPLNFNSPYKAVSIIEFWRRWHMTLSRFLRDYVYISLGGNRSGKYRRWVNLMLTMLLGGIWHGASWNFVIWGLLHGIYLVVCHAWGAVCGRLGVLPGFMTGSVGRWCACTLTLLFVMIAWIPFRAPTLDAAWRMVIDLVPFGSHAEGVFALSGNIRVFFMLALLMLLTLVLPNTQSVMRYDPRNVASVRVSYPAWWWFLAGGAASLAMVLLAAPANFLYFNF